MYEDSLKNTGSHLNRTTHLLAQTMMPVTLPGQGENPVYYAFLYYRLR